jgi:hypothetical protein
VSIVRIGLAETKNFSEGYEAIFGKKKTSKEQPAAAKKSKKSPSRAKKKPAKKK